METFLDDVLNDGISILLFLKTIYVWLVSHWIWLCISDESLTFLILLV